MDSGALMSLWGWRGWMIVQLVAMYGACREGEPFAIVFFACAVTGLFITVDRGQKDG